MGGAVATTSMQTQPGLPASSSQDAELREITRTCCEAIFVDHMAMLDFGLEVKTPRVWWKSTAGITAARRIGPGSKLRRLDVCEFCFRVLFRRAQGPPAEKSDGPGDLIRPKAAMRLRRLCLREEEVGPRARAS